MSSLPAWLRIHLLPNDYPAFHGLRFWATVLVVQAHVTNEFQLRGLVDAAEPAVWMSGTGWFAVDLFFILSGFLISTMILAARSRSQFSWGRFYGRRALRIFPPYYAVLTLLALSMQAWGMLSAAQANNLWREYAYVANYADSRNIIMIWAWSLMVEEHFIVVVPFLIAGLARLPSLSARLCVLVAGWLSALGIRLSIVAAHADVWTAVDYFNAVFIPTHARFDLLLAGCALAFVRYERKPLLDRVFASRGVRHAARGIAVLCLVAVVASGASMLSCPRWAALCLGTLTSVGFLAWLGVILHRPGAGERWLEHAWFRPIDTLGYGIYLLHLPLLFRFWMPLADTLEHAAVPIGITWLLVFIATWASSVGLAYALHLSVEKPARLLRQRLQL